VKCVICQRGETYLGTGTVTLQRGETTVVFKKVPAQVCANCGEKYYDEETTKRLFQTAQEAAQAGVQVEVREYLAA